MNLENRITSFVETGRQLANPHDPLLRQAALTARAENPWFTAEHVRHAMDSWASLLTLENLTEWVRPYRERMEKSNGPKTVGVVMAGNIPMVGFHDMLCVLISGNRLRAKLSAQDRKLLPAIASILISRDPEWQDFIAFEEGLMKGFDAIIATGSTNTTRYFEYYFGKYPNIIRGSRSSVAVLTGGETEEELAGLAADIFLYFGLGCRSVSRLLLPEGYDLARLDGPFRKYAHFYDHHRYRNNYDYHRSVYLVSQIRFYDGGFYLMKEDPSPASPVSVIHYGFYKDGQEAESWIANERDRLQCIVYSGGGADRVRPGKSQSPGLADYADGIDTMAFLADKI